MMALPNSHLVRVAVQVVLSKCVAQDAAEVDRILTVAVLGRNIEVWRNVSEDCQFVSDKVFADVNEEVLTATLRNELLEGVRERNEVVLERASVEHGNGVHGKVGSEDAALLARAGGDGAETTWLLGVVELDLLGLHVDAANTVALEEGEVNPALVLAAGDGWALEGQRERVLLDGLGLRSEDL